jgi:hypothetical protein
MLREERAHYPEPVSAGDKFAYLWKWVPLALVIIFVAIVRIRLLGFPLERDEGEYAYLGQLILQGVPPYKLAYNMKFPGVYFMYAVIMAVFGQTSSGIHFGLLLANIVSIILLYLVARKITDHTGAIVASCAYGVLSLGPGIFGFAAHATHFVVLFTLAGLWTLLRSFEKKSTWGYLWGGVFFGSAILMKQSAVFSGIFGALAVVGNVLSSKPLSMKNLCIYSSVYLAGLVAPIAAVFIFLYSAGVFDKFWFWTFTYISHYVAQIPLDIAAGVFKKTALKAIDGFYLMWALSVAGLIMGTLDKRLSGRKLLLVSFALFSFLSVCLGFYFREHYYIVLLPVLSILAGVFCYSVEFFTKNRYLAVTLFLIAVFAGVGSNKEYFFTAEASRLARAAYGVNPFPESVEIAKFVAARTRPDDTIAILGSEPQILFYSKRRSATGYIYTYNLMEDHPYSLKMQGEMAADIESKQPKIIIDVQIVASWGVVKSSREDIFHWADRYIAANYRLVGVADIFRDHTVYEWGEAARKYSPRSPDYIRVYERGV